MSQEDDEMRKGPWTEQEDVQLVCFVNAFGDRRWDFIAKVSGLKRSGKSCRLRWVNYLHPGLKRGKMTPQEECRILELHSKWGNRWSRIARKLPGRTDNEIKNYWRTHMRKKAQENKRALSPSSSLMSNSSSYSTNDSMTKEKSFYEEMVAGSEEGYNSMDEIWKDIDILESNDVFDTYKYITTPPIWDYSFWMFDGQEEIIGSNILFSRQQANNLTQG